MRILTAIALLATTAGALAAQSVIDPGMTKAQVTGRLGKPAAERSADSSTFLYYHNGLEKRVGMNDVVVLVNDKVVDAMFRSSTRRYSGQSSSPAAIPPEVAARKGPGGGAPMKVPAARSAPTPAQKLQPQRAPAGEVAKPIPEAKSAIRDAERAASEKAKATPKALADPKAPSASKTP